MVEDDKPADPLSETVQGSPKADPTAQTAVAPSTDPAMAPTVAPTGARTVDPAMAPTMAEDEPPVRRSRISMSKLQTFAPGEVVNERYKVTSMLGHGGMGDVYLATDLELRTDIALKTVRGPSTGSRAERFRREIFLARKVTHPNVCRVFDIGRATKNGEQVLFITMELLRGKSLADKLKDQKKLPTSEAFVLIAQIANAMEAAHQAGIVHRDLKPGNVMLVSGDDGKEIAKVTDFGVAHAAGDPFEDVSGTGDIVGSPAYMAPEQLEGLDPTPRADIYALGIMIYEMVTGVRPFHGETSLSSAVKRLKVDPDPPSEYLPDISPIWEATILRCLRREPKERFQTMGQVLEALSGGPTARVPKLDPSDLADTPSPRSRKPRIPVWVVPLGVATIGLAALLVIKGGGKTSSPKPPAPPTSPSSGPVAAAKPVAPDAASAPESTVLAVLPFKDRSPKKENEYLADGITEELLVLVGKLPRVTVIGRTSAFALKDTQDDAATIGRKLGVSRLLEGSIVTVKDRVRITAALVDATDGKQLWSESYDRSTADLFALQDEIAAAVARALAVELVSTPAAAGERTGNAKAHELVLRARTLLARDYDKRELQQASDAYEEAIKLDPSYASAFAGLALTQYWMRDFSGSKQESDRLIKRALELADKARAIGPDVAEVHAVRGFLFSNITWDWASARAELERAIELEPSDRETLRMYGGLLALLGQSDKALEALQKAVAADPLSARAWAHLAYMQTSVGQNADARKSLAKTLELNPTSNVGHMEAGTLELLEGHPDAAAAHIAPMPMEVYRRILGALVEHSLGHKAKSDELLASLVKNERHNAALQIAEIYAWRGDVDHAFEWLDNAVGDHDAGLMDVRTDPLLATLRLDPRYRALLTKLGL